MSILTKICVVVLVVLVLLGCPIFITLATVGPNYRDEFVKEQIKSKRFEHTAQTERVVAALRYDELQVVLKEITDLQQKLDAERTQYDLQIRELQGTLAECAGEKKIVNAVVAKLTIVTLNDQTRIAALTNDLTAMRQRVNELTMKSLDIKNELQEVISNRDSLNLQAKTLREENQRLTRENLDLRGKLALTPSRKTERVTVPQVAPDIRGRIVAVSQDVASINIGSAQGIKPGVKLMVYRGGDFVGHLLVRDAEVGEAFGIIIDKRLEPMRGDMVKTIPK